jgi:hypothetical protein
MFTVQKLPEKNLSQTHSSSQESAISEEQDDPQEIKTKVKEVQNNIVKSLSTTYPKCNEDYRFGYFEHPDRFWNANFKNVKLPLANILRKIGMLQLKLPVQLACMVSLYEHIEKIHNQIDTASGEFGKVLAKHKYDMHDFKCSFRDLSKDIQRKIDLFNLTISRHHGFDHAKSITGNFHITSIDRSPTQEFHIVKIEKLKRKINNKAINQLVDGCHNLGNAAEVTVALNPTIFALQCERLKLDLASLITDCSLTQIDKNKLSITYLVQREILRNFKDCLLVEEKNFFWGWLSRANLMWTWERRYDSELYIESEKYYKYQDNEGFTDLLNNKKLSREFDYKMDQLQIITKKEIDDIFMCHKKNLQDFRKLFLDSPWSLLAQYDESKWLNRLRKLMDYALVMPLQKLEAMQNNFCNDKVKVNDNNQIDLLMFSAIDNRIDILASAAKNVLEEIETLQPIQNTLILLDKGNEQKPQMVM